MVKVLLVMFIISFFFLILRTLRARRSVVILKDHWIEHWVRGKKKQVLVLGPDLHIHADLIMVSSRPIVRLLYGIKLYKRGLGSIDLKREDGWAGKDLKELWWALYSKDKRYRFQYDTEVELIKKAAAR